MVLDRLDCHRPCWYWANGSLTGYATPKRKTLADAQAVADELNERWQAELDRQAPVDGGPALADAAADVDVWRPEHWTSGEIEDELR